MRWRSRRSIPGALRDAVAGADDLAAHWQRSLERLQVIVDHWPRYPRRPRRDRPRRAAQSVLRRSPSGGGTPAVRVHRRGRNHHGGAGGRGARRAGSRGCPAAWWSFRACGWLISCRTRNGTRSGRTSNGRVEADPPAISAQAAARPYWRRARGSPGHGAFRAGALRRRRGRGRSPMRWRRQHFRTNGRPCDQPSGGSADIRGGRAARYRGRGAGDRLALREALETPGKTAALVTPDRQLARRVSALLARWGIEADDSAGTPLSQTAPGTLLLGIASAAAEELGPVALLALAKHPLVGGEGDERLAWLDDVRAIDLKLRGPRPPAGLAGLDARAGGRERQRVRLRIAAARRAAEPADRLLDRLAERLAATAQALAGDAAWRGPAGRMAAELLGELQGAAAAAKSMSAPRTRCRCSRNCSTSTRCDHPTAGIRGFSSGACWKRDCSARTSSFSAASTKALAGAARARSVASAQGPGEPRYADARQPDRACRA